VRSGSSEEYDPAREEGPSDDEDGEVILDKSSDEGPKQNRKEGKKSGVRRLRMAIHSAQGKSFPDEMNAKHKASQDVEGR
jgi:hypothetical protein